jgi:tetratricopeptide (TPR) repeat protein
MSLNNLSADLSDLGRREDALTAGEEAVAAYRALAAARPDAFLPDLARSLTNLTSRLADLGRREEGAEGFAAILEEYEGNEWASGVFELSRAPIIFRARAPRARTAPARLM